MTSVCNIWFIRSFNLIDFLYSSRFMKFQEKKNKIQIILLALFFQNLLHIEEI